MGGESVRVIERGLDRENKREGMGERQTDRLLSTMALLLSTATDLL